MDHTHRLATAIAALGAGAGAAAAATFPFRVVVDETTLGDASDPYAGASGSGAIEVPGDAPMEDGPLDPGEAALSVTLFGQTFSGADDAFGTPLIEFANGAPSFLGITLDENDPVNPIAINREGVSDISIFDAFETDDDGLVIEALVNFGAPAPAPIPLPAGLPLAVAGLGALWVLRSRRA